MIRLKKYLPLLIIAGLLTIVLMFDLHHYFSFDSFKDNQSFLESFIAQNFFLSVLIYIVLYIIVVSLSIPGATFMTLAGGFLLGQWIGTISAVIAATIGAIILFLSAKMVSSDFFSQKSASWVEDMQKGFKRNALSYLLTLRLIPLFPFVVVNLAAAFFQIPIRTFCLGTFIGIIPGSFVYVSIGVALREVIQKPEFSANIVLDPKILIALTGLGILSLMPVIYNHFKKKS